MYEVNTVGRPSIHKGDILTDRAQAHMGKQGVPGIPCWRGPWREVPAEEPGRKQGVSCAGREKFGDKYMALGELRL
jgi:hypothetical protein